MPLTIIGTSHIAKQSVQEIKKAIIEKKPDFIAVELDKDRALSLLKNTMQPRSFSLKDVQQVGIQGYIFVRVGQFIQQKLGRVVGISPGAEMKAALELANKEKIPILYIDQPLPITLKRLSSGIKWREKLRIVADLLTIFIPSRLLKKKTVEKFDLTTVPAQEVISKLLVLMKERYPTLHRVLLEERNKYMVQKLVAQLRKDSTKNILVIVGAAHKEGMEELLLKVDVLHP